MKKFWLFVLVNFLTNPAFARVNVIVSQDGNHNDYLKIVFGTIILILTICSYFIWRRFGKDDIVIPVVNFYPPNGINPAEAELAYKGFVSEKGIVGMVISLASKGFIKIVEEGNTFSLVRLKDVFSGLDRVEKTLMKALDPFDYSFVTKEELRSSYIFYDISKNIIEEISKKRNMIFYKDSINVILRSIMICFLVIVVILTVLYGFYFNRPDSNGIIYGVLCTIVCSICTYHLPKRNNTGNKLLGGLLGLKHFIEAAKKHELEMLVEKNPDYFYDILPYAYVLDVSDKWISKFENITILEPKWLMGNKFYSTSNLNRINAFLDVLSSQIHI